MSSIDAFGGAGQRLSAPSLSEWAEAVRDAILELQGAEVWGRWSGTQAQYDAITVKDPNTLYVVLP